MSDMNIPRARAMSLVLRMAVIAGVESAVRIHVERGDDLNARDASGMTPLMLAAARNKPAICLLLLNAGADHALLSPVGRTAYEIAVAARSDAAATAILNAVSQPIADATKSDVEFGLEQESESIFSQSFCDSAGVLTPATSEGAGSATPDGESREPELPIPPQAKVNDTNDGDFDLSAWEAEDEPARPAADYAVQDSASAIQISITAHEPIDSSTGWDDIEAYLPEVALPLASTDDVEGRAWLRRLLLRALREGSVPKLDVQALSTNEDRTANAEAEAYLSMVINDLGAEVDERFEYSSADESFEVYVQPDETSEEETALDEALVAIDRAASPRHEPLRLYQREFQRLRLLTADEEIQLAKNMEAALEGALDALAAWPEGIARILAASAQAIAGSRPISSIWGGNSETDVGANSAEILEPVVPADDLLDGSIDEGGELVEAATADADDASFRHALRRLGELVDGESLFDGPLHEVRQALSALRLNRRFLLELLDLADGSAPCLGFVRAMADFRKARDSMAAANLKLAFFHAKKYLYSGEPLDDLAQEGNIGLLKAIDRYDWRRGYRFSTYATWWIRQQISRSIADKARTIRLPVYIHEKIQRLERVVRTFEDAVGRQPTLDELVEPMEMPSDKISWLLDIAPEPLSIDDLTVDGMIAADVRDEYVMPDPADIVEEIQLKEATELYISSLSASDRRDERILRFRFGIGVDAALTLDEIGTIFGLTRERIRQIEARAIKKLQHPVRSKSFARLVLGLELEDNACVPGVLETDRAYGSGFTQALTRPTDVMRSAPLAPSRESIQHAASSTPSELDRILAQATGLGIHVEDDRLGSGRIWVNIVDARDANHRQLIRRVHELGFQFWPGKGYWL